MRQSGHPLRDLVTFHQYDGFGRETRRFLPFVSLGSNNGEYIENPEEKVYTFYETALRVAETVYPYSEVIFESSPLSRVLEEGNVGEAWQLTSGHTVKVRNLLNENSEVLLWTNSENGCSAMSQGSPVYYPENSLSKKHVVDATGASFWEYSDLFGRVICKRTFARMNGVQDAPYTETTSTGKLVDNSNIGLPGSGPIDTQLDVYFIYDAFGRLVYEIPTIAIKAFNGSYEFSTVSNGVNYAIYNGYLTASKYDKWGRIIERKKPGEEWTLYVYNKLDQVILSKSPELSEQGNKWSYVKYDIYGRPIQTGLYTSNLTRDGLQDMADYTAIYSTIAEDRTGNASIVYTNETFPNSNLELYTETYYDDYNFDINGFTYNYIETAPEIQSKRTRGIVTGSKVKVLDDSNNYLINVQYVDRNGRSAVQFAENILGGFDKMTNIYDYQGKLLESRRYFKKSDSNVDVIHVVNRFEFDHAGRLTLTKQKINSDEEVTVSKLVYNDLGQVVKKHLHISGSANMGMQVIDYRYNERGWLTKINNSDLTNDGDNMESWDVFGEELIYHNIEDYNCSAMQVIAQYGGNISATKWKTNISQELDAAQLGGHSYVYRYDDLGQMTGAFYAGSADDYIDNYNQNLNFWDEKVSYDSNGNVLALHRTRGKEADGMEAVSPITVDLLSYQYNDNSNKLKSITDGGMNLWIPNTLSNSFAHFIDGNAGSDDYSYDSEGRLISDANKGLEYTYNHLDLVSSASYGSENIDFVWDASGVKHAKIVGQTVYYYFGGIEYKDDVISHINTSEGIARPFDSNQLNTNWNYDYYLKDHLGNVRAVITEENSELVTEKVTVEMAVRLLEDSNFDNVSATEKDKPYLYPYDPSDVFNQKVAELSKLTGKIIGPAKVMEVKRGEKVDVSTKYWYMEEPGEPLTDLTEIIAGTLFNLSMASSSIIPQGPEMGMALLNNVNGEQFGNLNNFLSNSFEDIELDKPKAYIVYISFDKKMMLDVNNSGVIQVSDANTLGQLSKKDIIFRTDGYFYVYVTNQSEALVNFDNLTITRWKPQVRVTYDYYPFGLTWENPKLEDTEEGLHDHTCQDKEFLFAEFADGRGLELLDFHARMYDPTTCRWSVPDPAAQFANPYLAMGNNPVIYVDPDGEWVHLALGGVRGGVISYIEGREAGIRGWELVGFTTLGIAAGVGSAAVNPASITGNGFYFKPVVSGGSHTGALGIEVGYSVSVGFGAAKVHMTGSAALYYSTGHAGTGRSGFYGRLGMATGVDFNRFGMELYTNQFFGGDIDQRTGGMKFGFGKMNSLGFRFATLTYENDFMFGIPGADGGDRFRTAALRVDVNPFGGAFEGVNISAGFNLFTGDPGLDLQQRSTNWYQGTGVHSGRQVYNEDVPYRLGSLYLGIGSLRLGADTEGIRHVIQNKGAHDNFIKWFRGKPVPHFQVQDKKNRFYWSIGNDTINSLWEY